jgi:hypothetical protein
MANVGRIELIESQLGSSKVVGSKHACSDIYNLL